MLWYIGSVISALSTENNELANNITNILMLIAAFELRFKLNCTNDQYFVLSNASTRFRPFIAISLVIVHRTVFNKNDFHSPLNCFMNKLYEYLLTYTKILLLIGCWLSGSTFIKRPEENTRKQISCILINNSNFLFMKTFY